MRKLFSVLLLILGLFSSVNAQFLELPEDKVKVKFDIQQNKDEATIIASITIVPGWHINAVNLPKGSFGIPTSFTIKADKAFTLVGGIIEPKPVNKYDEIAEEHLSYHEGKLQFKRKIKIHSAKDFTLKGEFNFQTCNEFKCLPDHTYSFSLDVKAAGETSTEVVTSEPETPIAVASTDLETHIDQKSDTLVTETPAALVEPAKSTNKSNWIVFLLAFGSGLIALITPCVFPMIPMTVSFFTKGGRDKKKGLKDAITYGLCIVGIYTAVGLLVKLTGTGDYLNRISTDPLLNIIFFIVFIIFALSFLGAFEIRVPSKLINKADEKADKGGFIGIFFMALVLVLVSFSCTGPILGTLIISSASNGGNAILAGMFGFGLALGLPFAFFAAFPSWLNNLPKSGGWLNTVKVVLGLFELAFAFKFLSNADLSLQTHLLEREVFIAIWIAVFSVMALNLFGVVLFPHDDKPERIGVGRGMLGTFILALVVYMIPGLFGHPLKLISAFPPPIHYSESPEGPFTAKALTTEKHDFVEGTHLGPQNIYVFHDLELAQAYAAKVNKPVFIDFTGHNCVNCRKMEMSVWSEPGIIDMLRNDYVIASLYVDERTPLPKDKQTTVTYPDGSKRKVETVGQKWMAEQIMRYSIASQPYYRVVKANGEEVESIGSAGYETHRDPKKFRSWLEEGLKAAN